MSIRGVNFVRRQKKRAVDWWAQSEERAIWWQRRAQAARISRQLRRRLIGSAEPLVVCFVVTRPTTWHLEGLYQLLNESRNYEPYVLVSRLEEDMSGKEYRGCLAFVRDHAYREPPRSSEVGGLVAADWLVRVDALFYDLPYDHYHVDQRLVSDNFPYAFQGYLPYGVRSIEATYVDWDLPTVLNCTRYYCETEWHRQYNLRRCPKVGRRTLVAGYPTTHRILGESRVAREAAASTGTWLTPQEPKLLWAPHWSWALSPTAAWRFLTYHRFLCNMARQGRVELWYRPHPLLDVRLKKMAPTQFSADDGVFPPGTSYRNAVDMDYVDLFSQVDLIVHNSGSFLSEFIATGKPAVFITDESFIEANLGDFGRRALAASYQVGTETQLQDALVALLGGKDELAKDRLDFASYLDEEMAVDPNKVIAADLERAFRLPL